MGNTVGSLEIPSVLRARKNMVLRMTEQQRDILIGCVLGDAYISPKGNIRIEQSTIQKEYLWWKYHQLQSLAYPSLPKEINRIRKPDNQEYSSVYFELRRYFRPWRSVFYENGKKIFPRDLLMKPISLAIWYMDDGCWTGTKCVVATEGFDDKSIERMQEMLQTEWNIQTIVGKNRRIVVRKQSHDTFYGLICPYVISSMKRKLPNPVTTSSAVAEESPIS